MYHALEFVLLETGASVGLQSALQKGSCDVAGMEQTTQVIRKTSKSLQKCEPWHWSKAEMKMDRPKADGGGPVVMESRGISWA
jgi:hypothetical protein